MREGHVPKHCRHAPTGRGFVRLNGKQVYTGRWGTEEAARKYERLVAEWMLSGRQRAALDAGDGVTMLSLLDAWAKAPPSAAAMWAHRTRRVREAMEASGVGGVTPERFGPKAYKLVRQRFVDMGYCRRMVNELASHLRAMVRWAVEEELAPLSCYHGLKAVPGVRKGTPGVVDREPVGPVPQDVLDATLAVLPEPYASMVRVQLLTGMRPGEVRTMRPRDIDRSGDVWFYRPKRHKTAWRDRNRSVAIGPKAQALLGPLLDRVGPAEPLFRPRASNKPYRAVSYYAAIMRAADRAGVPHWGLNRLRHNAATEIRRAFGLDAVQAALGHASAKTSELYALLDERKAAEVARLIG